MLTPAAAEKLIHANMVPFPGEDCPLAEAHGRVLRSGIRADRDLPPFDRVTLDGYALRASALAAGTRTFRVEGTQAAGVIAQKLGPLADACIEIMTGAVLPIGADCVVPYENTTKTDATLTMTVNEMPGRETMPGNAVHPRGSDQLAGNEIVRSGTRLGSREIAVAAACGYANLAVAAQPRIAVIATGDELVEVGMPVGPHQVRRSNDYALRAALVSAGYSRVERFHLRDVKAEIERQLSHVLAEFDVVLLSGGISKGKFDFLPTALATLGVTKVFQGVAQRPGKPLWFGVSARRTPVFALPGNPVSTYTCFLRYVLPALAHASGLTWPAPRLVALAAPFAFKAPLACFLPVRLSSGPAAQLLADPGASNTSGDFSSLVATDGFVELPADRDEFPAGSIVPFRPWC